MSTRRANTVFITQQPRPNNAGWTPNLTPAAKFGALEFIFEAEDKPFLNPTKALLRAQKALADFDPERDYILWPNSGDPAGAVSVFLALGSMDIDQVRLLYWDRKLENGQRSTTEGFYTPITFKL
jgi:hypothetical protein